MLEVLDPIPHGNYNFRSAIYAEGGSVIEEKSALSAVIDGEIKDGESIDVVITGQDENFNGIAVGGKGPYKVSGADISLEGNGGNDFIGYGAAVMARRRFHPDRGGFRDLHPGRGPGRHVRRAATVSSM